MRSRPVAPEARSRPPPPAGRPAVGDGGAVRVGVGSAPELSERSHMTHDTDVHLSGRGIAKSYWKGQLQVPVLQGLDLEVRRGEMLSVMGASGSGKSTLLHVLGTLDEPDTGGVWAGGRRI